VIKRLKLSISNAYLVRGERCFLVDTGCESDYLLLKKQLAKEGFGFEDIACILHTHGHGDHTGCSARLQKEFGTPTVLHAADELLVLRGSNGILKPASILGRLMKPFVDKPFPSFHPSMTLVDPAELSSLGFPGYAIHTPGHTAGSISLVVGDSVILGDLASGSPLGGATVHLFVEDLAMLQRSIECVLATGARHFYPGHFSSFRSEDLARFCQRLQKKIPDPHRDHVTRNT
jgi:glyoxylase-like metal-dependent hydrolase (beta-lactamase superfamily II)